jgi:hypothetical protein
VTEQSRRTLVAKHFNVMDPLLPHNNLGRSVSQSNLIRIRAAFAHGAAKLHKALHHSDPADAVAEVRCLTVPPPSSCPQGQMLRCVELHCEAMCEAAIEVMSNTAVLFGQVDRFFSKLLRRSCYDNEKENAEDGQGKARRPSANGQQPPPSMLPMSLQLRSGYIQPPLPPDPHPFAALEPAPPLPPHPRPVPPPPPPLPLLPHPSYMVSGSGSGAAGSPTVATGDTDTAAEATGAPPSKSATVALSPAHTTSPHQRVSSPVLPQLPLNEQGQHAPAVCKRTARECAACRPQPSARTPHRDGRQGAGTHGSTPGRRSSEVSSEATDESTAPSSVGVSVATKERAAHDDTVEEGGVAILLDDFPRLPLAGRDGADGDDAVSEASPSPQLAAGVWLSGRPAATVVVSAKEQAAVAAAADPAAEWVAPTPRTEAGAAKALAGRASQAKAGGLGLTVEVPSDTPLPAPPVSTHPDLLEVTANEEDPFPVRRSPVLSSSLSHKHKHKHKHTGPLTFHVLPIDLVFTSILISLAPAVAGAAFARR